MAIQLKLISSRQNPLVARFRAAAHNEDKAVVLLDGTHLVDEAISAGIDIEDAIVASGEVDNADIVRLVGALQRAGTSVAEATSAVMAAVSPVRSASAIVALAKRPPNAGAAVFAHAGTPLVVVACGVQDPGNIGAIVRVAEAAGATGFVALGASADPFGWKALRGSMGSALRVPVAIQPDDSALILDAKKHGCRVVATVPRGGVPLFDAGLGGPLAILVGGEGPGLPPALVQAADIRVTIPMAAPVESLNTAVSAALLLYEVARQRR